MAVEPYTPKNRRTSGLAKAGDQAYENYRASSYPVITSAPGLVMADDLSAARIEAVRTAIVTAVRTVLASCGRTQAEIAVAAGLDQPRVSRLLRGTTNALASERALAMLNSLGYDVTIVVERRLDCSPAEGVTWVEFKVPSTTEH